jgi:hypothetical protein
MRACIACTERRRRRRRRRASQRALAARAAAGAPRRRRRLAIVAISDAALVISIGEEISGATDEADVDVACVAILWPVLVVSIDPARIFVT